MFGFLVKAFNPVAASAQGGCFDLARQAFQQVSNQREINSGWVFRIFHILLSGMSVVKVSAMSYAGVKQ